MNRNPLPATTFDSSFPPDLDHVITRAMAKDPAQRYPTGREMAADLRGLREALGQTRGSNAGSFDAMYVQPASKVVSELSSWKKPSSIGNDSRKPPKHRGWRDWHFIAAGLLALSAAALWSAFVWQQRTPSESKVPEEPGPPASDAARAVNQQSRYRVYEVG